MKRVIIESPYAGNIERNTEYAKRCLQDSINRREAPLASHLLYPAVLDEHNPAERALGIELGYAWMHVATLVVFYIDYGMSPGMHKAESKADSLSILTEKRTIGKNL